MNTATPTDAAIPPAQDSLDLLVGNTPMIKLRRLADGIESTVLLKLEGCNPAGSVKDRVALNMILQAERRGDIKPGGSIIEATSGNTGIALAMIAAAKGYKLTVIMPDHMSQERRDAMRAYGANLILVPHADGQQASRVLAAKMAREGHGFLIDQFNNHDNTAAHHQTGQEIWTQTEGKITHLVAGCGTGGTATGCAQFLYKKNPAIDVYAVQPAPGDEIAGTGTWAKEYLPAVLNANVEKEVHIVTAKQADAERTMRQLCRLEGVSCGPSGGAVTHMALSIAKANPGSTVVAIIPDRSDRYLSTGLFSVTDAPEPTAQ